ncbi:MAG: multicopper oxidase domain-containing protein [Gemmatimonadaceae bacterium]
MRAVTVALSIPLLLASAVAPRPPVGVANPCAHLPPAPGPRATANDNRTSAGVRRGDTLFLSLVAAPSAWYPEAETGCALPVLAFAEAGKQPSIPGPLVRVRAGTVLRVSVRNAAGRTIWVRGLHDRPAARHPGVELAPDSAREFAFTVTAPGTYAYSVTLVPRLVRTPADGPPRDESQLLGALIVDPTNAPDVPRDRVMVLTRWTVSVVVAGDTAPRRALFFVNAVNGKSWPHTEQLSYAEGDSVHWRVINLGSLPHPLHLHGFYFRVDARGTLSEDTTLARSRTVVTEALTNGQTMRLSWLADRPGNWLFHCHLIAHMSTRQQLGRMSDSANAALADLGARPRPAGDSEHGAEHSPTDASHTNHATDGMSGLIVGVQVRPAARGRGVAGRRDARGARGAAPRRSLRLFANQRPGVFANGAPGYGFVLQEDDREPARDSVRFPGSPIILRRGEPVRITVFNHLTVPLSVHWHGLELDSYFDGVGDWSGSAGNVAPAIAPGDSFVVRLTPPRAGTFMYHVHGEEGEELASGLHGPLLVLDDPAALDTLADKVLLVSDAGPLRPGERRGFFVNGTLTPRLTLTAGKPHRLRLIGITGNGAADIAILSGSETVRWRLLARDGAELTGAPEPLTPARVTVRPGMIADYELTPVGTGELMLDMTVIERGRPVSALRAPITIVPPTTSLGRRAP